MHEREVKMEECATALKEWATVLEAMGRGEQLVLIRKGGLIEPDRLIDTERHDTL